MNNNIFYNMIFLSFFIPEYIGININHNFFRFKQGYILVLVGIYIVSIYKKGNLKETIFKIPPRNLILITLFVLFTRNPSVIYIPMVICLLMVFCRDKKQNIIINNNYVKWFIIINFLLVLLQLKFNFKVMLTNSFLKVFINEGLIHDPIYRGGISRAIGLFGHPLYLGNFFSLLVLYCIEYFESNKEKSLYISMSLFIMLMAFSRTAILNVLIICLYFGVKKLAFLKERIKKQWIYISMFFAVSIIPLVFVFFKQISLNERSDLYRFYGALLMIKKIFSTASNFFLGNINQHTGVIDKTYVNGIEILVNSVDNFYIQYLYNYGVIIFILTLIFIMGIYRESKFKYKTILLIVAIVMNLFTSAFEWDFNTTLLFFLLLMLENAKDYYIAGGEL